MPQESKPEQVRTGVQEARQEGAATRRPWYSLSRTAKRLLLISAVVLLLFTVLACWVHTFPVNQLDLLIPHEFQENPAPWLHLLMAFISYPGSTPLLSACAHCGDLLDFGGSLGKRCARFLPHRGYYLG
jgi:hypothetical protein